MQGRPSAARMRGRVGRMESTVTCREFVEFLAEYLAGRLPPGRSATFDAHLAECPSCLRYTRTYRQTIRLGQDAFRCPDERVPAGVPEDLVRAILAAREENT
jgi:anti-sigma factor RsiW